MGCQPVSKVQVEAEDQELTECDQGFKELRTQLQAAQNHMKKVYDVY